MDTLLAIILGVSMSASLSAACGFRVFPPMLVMSIAAMAGRLDLADGWNWIASWPALIVFAVATATETCGYYVPWLDNVLDTIASPAAVVAGIVATAACVSGIDPLLKWSLAIIGGGGAAGLLQGSTVLLRGASTATTGGLGNPVVATSELIMSFVLPLLAIVVPILAGIILCGLCGGGFFVFRRILRRRAKRAASLAVEQTSGP